MTWTPIQEKQASRNPLQRYFLTFPKSREVSIESLIQLLPSYEYYIACRETHKDGTPHIHICISLEKKITKSQLLKPFKEEYPDDWKRIHVRSTRNFNGAVDYCKKEDTNYIEQGTPPNLGGKCNRKRRLTHDQYVKIIQSLEKQILVW